MSDKQIKNPRLGKGFYTILGSYKVKKKDILFYTNMMNEREVMSFPESTRIIDFRFLNLRDYIASRAVVGLMNTFESHFGIPSLYLALVKRDESFTGHAIKLRYWIETTVES